MTVNTLILTHSDDTGGMICQLLKAIGQDKTSRVVASREDYSQGPLSSQNDVHAFFQGRQDFWQDVYDAPSSFKFSYHEPDQHLAVVEEIKSGAVAELWIADSVQDFFFAAVTVHLLKLNDVDTKKLSLRQFEGTAVKWGLGLMPLDEFRNLYQTVHSIALNVKVFDRLWDAISQSRADAICEFMENCDEYPSLTSALRVYLRRYPEHNDGLGAVERLLLRSASVESKPAARVVGNAMALNTPWRDMFGDVLLFKRLIELCDESETPWFRLSGDPQHMRSCAIQLTTSGQKVRDHHGLSYDG